MKTDSGYLENVVSVSAGDSHVLALDRQGNVWAWGSNKSGALGDGTTSDRKTPIKVKLGNGSGSLTNIIYISAGSRHSMAIDRDGNIWVWGDNTEGKLGIGDTNNRLYPTLIIRENSDSK